MQSAEEATAGVLDTGESSIITAHMKVRVEILMDMVTPVATHHKTMV